jgi:anti-anti-sigma factor
MRIHFEQRTPLIIARVSGSLTGQTSAQLDEEILKKLQKETTAVVLNLSDLDYVSSAGIGSVAQLYKNLQDRNCTMAIVAAPSRVKMLFELAGLTELVPFRDREMDVLGSVNG